MGLPSRPLYIFFFLQETIRILDSFESSTINSLKISSQVKKKLSKLYLKYKRKMVGSNGTMIAIRLVRSKLRKREDHSNAIHPEPAVVQTATTPPVSTIVSSSYPVEGCCTQTSTTTMSTDLGNNTSIEQDTVYASANPTDQFVWQFPPPYPPPHTPAQYALYNDQVGKTVFSFSLPIITYISCGLGFVWCSQRMTVLGIISRMYFSDLYNFPE